MLSQRRQREHLRRTADKSGLRVGPVTLPTNHQVQLNGLLFHYVDWGGEGRPAVFLHGGGLTARTWDLVCLALRTRLRCVALDLRGHGDSQWSSDGRYSFDDHATDLAAFVGHLGVEGFLLVGMSLGALTALTYAEQDGHPLDGLVLVDAGPRLGPPRPTQGGSERIRNFFAAPPILNSVEDFVERAIAFNPARDRALLRTSLLHNLRRLPNGTWTWKYDRLGLLNRNQEQFRASMAALAGKVHRVACPTLIVRGAESDVFSDEDAEYLARGLQNGRWRKVAGAGHTVQGDNPKGLLEALSGFLDEIGY